MRQPFLCIAKCSRKLQASWFQATSFLCFLRVTSLAGKEYPLSRVGGKVTGPEHQVFGGARYGF